jgi:dephospho-CoA kinase
LTRSGSLVVGLAGKVAAGKDTLLPAFTRRGFAVFDADQLGHEALAAPEVAQAVQRRFGTIDRKTLGQQVFGDPKGLADLEALVHPWVTATLVQRLDQLAGQPAVVHAALLAKAGLESVLDAVIWVEAPLCTRLWRARQRDRRSWKFLLRRVWAQRKLGPQDFGADVDIHRVENPARPEQALVNLDVLLDRLIQVFPERKP